MKVELIGYPSCSTCKKAIKTLKDHEIEVTFRHIVEQTPSMEELKTIWKRSNLPLKKLFNTSGKVYQEMNLKALLSDMDDEKQLQLLSMHGMLLKRPILICESHVFIGFKEAEYALLWKKENND